MQVYATDLGGIGEEYPGREVSAHRVPDRSPMRLPVYIIGRNMKLRSPSLNILLNCRRLWAAKQRVTVSVTQIVERWGDLSDELKRAVLAVVNCLSRTTCGTCGFFLKIPIWQRTAINGDSRRGNRYTIDTRTRGTKLLNQYYCRELFLVLFFGSRRFDAFRLKGRERPAPLSALGRGSTVAGPFSRNHETRPV